LSFKKSLTVGYFDPITGIPLPLAVDVEAAREALVRAGGRLLEQCGPADAQRLAIAAAMKAHANREVLGFLGGEFVVLHESGFLMTTLGFGIPDAMYAFLISMCRERGCQIYSDQEGKVVTEEVLAQLKGKGDVFL
jgi:hypothetical protein